MRGHKRCRVAVAIDEGHDRHDQTDAGRTEVVRSGTEGRPDAIREVAPPRGTPSDPLHERVCTLIVDGLTDERCVSPPLPASGAGRAVIRLVCRTHRSAGGRADTMVRSLELRAGERGQPGIRLHCSLGGLPAPNT